MRAQRVLDTPPALPDHLMQQEPDMRNHKPCLDCGQERKPSHGGRGLCAKCYYIRTSQGLELPPKQRVSFEERLASMEKPEGECWPWTGYVNTYGYGGLGAGSTHGAAGAHVRSYVHHKGPVPLGFQVGHACHDRDLSCRKVRDCPHRRCVNPDHLVLQTCSENLRARRQPTHCQSGLHEKTDGPCKPCAQKTRRGYDARRKAAQRSPVPRPRETVEGETIHAKAR